MTERKIIGYDYFKLAVAILLILLMLVLRNCSGEPPIVVDDPQPATQVSPTDAPTATVESVALDPVANLAIDLPLEDFFAGVNQIEGSADPNASLEMIFNEQHSPTFESDANGAWQTEVELVEGENALQLVQLDADGAEIASSDVYTIVAKPVPVTGEALTLTINDIPTDLTAGAFTVSGTATAGSQIEAFLDGQSVGVVETDETGQWQLDFDLPAGEHALDIVAQSANGEESLTESASLTVASATADSGTSTGDQGNNADATQTGNNSNWVPDLSRCGDGKVVGNVYIVNYCENLSRIAKRLGIPKEDLIAANPQIENPDLIYPYQELTIP